MDTKQGKPWGGGDGGVMNWVIGIDMYTLMCIKLMTNKNLLYKKINRIKFKNSKKKKDSTLPMQGAQVQSLVRELDATCMPQLRVHELQLRSHQAATKTWRNQINKFFKKGWGSDAK